MQSGITCCLDFFILPFLHLIYGLISLVPTFLIIFLGSIFTAFFWIIPHIFLGIYSIWKAKQLGPNIKCLAILGIYVLLIFWFPLIIILSILVGIFYGYFGPLIHLLVEFWRGQSTIEACFGKNIIGVCKYSKNLIIDFWYLNKGVKEYLKDFREMDNGYQFEISLYKIFITPIIIIFSCIFNIIILLIIILILILPIICRCYISVLKFMFCCNNDKTSCLNLLGFICFVPSLFLLFLIPFIGPVLVILVPFYGIFFAVKAALYSFETDKLLDNVYYNKEFIVYFWYILMNFIKPKKYKKKFPYPRTNSSEIFDYDQQNNISVTVDKISIEYIWDNFFKMTIKYTKEALVNKTIDREDIETLEPYLFIGIPSYLVFKIVYRSLKLNGFKLASGKIITDKNRPNFFLINPIWDKLIDLKKKLKIIKLNGNEKKYIEIFLITMNKINKISLLLSEDQYPNKERIKKLHVLASHFQSLGTVISRMPAMPRRFGESLYESMTIDA